MLLALVFFIYFVLGVWTFFERNDQKVIPLFVSVAIGFVIQFGIAHLTPNVGGLYLMSGIMVSGYIVGGLVAAFIQYHSQIRQE